MWNVFQTRGPGMTPRFGFDWRTYTPLYNGQTPEQLSGSGGSSGSIPQKMDPFSIGLAVGVPLVTSLINNSFQSRANKRNAALYRQYMDMQRGLQRDAQSYNTMMWRMTNQWNSPSNQMALLRAAGLNPNLMYGGAFQGNASAQSSPSESVSAPGNIYNPLSMSLGNPAETYMAERQLSMQERTTDLMNTKQSLENQKLEFEVSKLKDTYDLTTEETQTRIASIKSSIKESQARFENLKEQKGLITAQTKAQVLMNLYDERAMDDKLQLLKDEHNLNEKQLSVLRWTINEIRSRIGVNRSIVKLNNAQSGYYDALSAGEFQKQLFFSFSEPVRIANMESGTKLNYSQIDAIYNKINWDNILNPKLIGQIDAQIGHWSNQDKIGFWNAFANMIFSLSYGYGQFMNSGPTSALGNKMTKSILGQGNLGF